MTKAQKIVPPLPRKIDQLSALSRPELIELWINYIGQSLPKATSTALLLRAVAYAIQERSLGGLKAADRRILLRLSGAEQAQPHAAEADGNVSSEDQKDLGGAPSIGDHQTLTTKKLPKSAPRPAARPGTRLVRNWQGRTHVVDVTDEGFNWNNNFYKSLTAIAREITGAQWSGPRFFRI